MQETKCLACDKQFKAKRSTATFCSESCRSNYYQKKQRRERTLAQYQKQVKECEQKIALAKDHLKTTHEKLSLLEQEIKTCEERKEELERLLSMDGITLAKEQKLGKVFGLTAAPYTIKPNLVTGALSAWMTYKALEATPNLIAQKRRQLEDERQSLCRKLPWLKIQQSDFLQSIQNHKAFLSQQQILLKDLQLKAKALEEEIIFAQKRRQKKALAKQVSSVGSSGVKASELMNTKFNTFTLPGALGFFLGRLERHKMAIALKGSPGAGKSNLSMGIAQLFALADFKVAYYSIEMGIGQALKDILKRFPVSDNVDFFDEPETADIEAKAVVYDVVVIDSFTRLDCPAIVLEEWRKKFPATIFVFIVQKNSQGTTRGGPALDFNATMIMELSFDKEGRRQVYMDKSRYGTQNWSYYPEEERVEPF